MKTRKYGSMLSWVAMLGAFPASATDLDANALRSLVSGKTWRTTKVINYERTDSWDWKADGTVCLRLDSKKGKCDDSGTWTIEASKLCYKLSWWNKSYGLSATCVGVADLGKGLYEARLSSGSEFLRFTVAPSAKSPRK